MLRFCCGVFVCSWESQLHAPGRGGYKLAQRGGDGQLLQEIVLSLEVVSEDRFSLSIVPPCVELSEKLMSDAAAAEFGAVVDQQTLAGLPPYAKTHPALFTFPLSKYDALVRMLRAPRPGASSHWIVAGIPEQARKALMEDLAIREAEEAAATAAAAGGEPQAETEMAEQICENMAMSGPASTASSAAAAAAASSTPPAAAAAAAASSDPMEDELSGSKKKKKKGSLLVPKRQAMDAAKKKEVGLTPEEEGCLNLDKVRTQRKSCRAVAVCFSTTSELTRFVRLSSVCAQLPGSLRNVLLQFQLEGVRYIISKHGRALLSDEMGSVQAAEESSAGRIALDCISLSARSLLFVFVLRCFVQLGQNDSRHQRCCLLPPRLAVARDLSLVVAFKLAG